MSSGFATCTLISRALSRLSATCLLGLFLFLSAQPAASAASPQFEVVSIKSDPPSPYEGGVQALPGGRLTAKKITARLLIQNAYALKPFQLLGGPKWMDSEGYDIEAKAAGNPGKEEMVLMIQSLLEDRFKLKYHRDTRQLPVYDLAPAKGGIKLRPPDNSCRTSKDKPATAACGRIMVQMGQAAALMRGRDVSMAELVRMLTNILGRPVVNKTGFMSSFDVNMDFAIDDVLSGFPVPPDAAPTGIPSILTAIQEQLGLKLVPAKGSVDVLVIDRIERPSEN